MTVRNIGMIDELRRCEAPSYDIHNYLSCNLSIKDAIKNTYAFFIARLFAGYGKQATKIFIGFFIKIHKYFFRCP